MPSPAVPLDLLIGPKHAAEFINGLVRDLMLSDLLPETVAYRLVCEGVTDGDPFLLADPGQMWTLRPGHNGPAPARLFIAHRDVTQLTVDDEHGQRHGIPLCALADYQLDQWYWARTDQHST